MMKEIVMGRLIMEGSREGVAFELCFEKKLVGLGCQREKEGILERDNSKSKG